MDKWERLYANRVSPWDSGKPSSHLLAYLRHGSVSASGSSATAAAAPIVPVATAPTPVPSRDALDIGCGSNGTNAALLASHGYRAAAVDCSRTAVARARATARAWLSGAAAAAPPRQLAFATCDVMSGDGSSRPLIECWEDVRRLEEREDQDEQEQEQEQAAAAAAPSQPRRFSLLFDCQTYHVLRLEAGGDEAVALRYRAMLEPGGVLVILCGRPAEGAARARARDDGPNEVGLDELRAAFSAARGWREREIFASRFDPTPDYDLRPDGPPLAWVALYEAV